MKDNSTSKLYTINNQNIRSKILLHTLEALVSINCPLLLHSPLLLNPSFSIHFIYLLTRNPLPGCPAKVALNPHVLMTFHLSFLTTLCISIPDHPESQSDCSSCGHVPSLVQSAVEPDHMIKRATSDRLWERTVI